MLLKARAEGDTRRCAVVATVVSSSAVGKMADIEGFEFHQTATGFKNIGAKGFQLKQQVRAPVFCHACPVILVLHPARDALLLY
jgi:phosphomannomutase